MRFNSSAIYGCYLTALEHCQNTLKQWSLYELASLLTLVLLLFYDYEHVAFANITRLFFIAALLYRPLLTSALAWFFMASLASYIVVHHWHPVANHKFLTTYWLWVLAFTHFVSDAALKERLIKFNARFLVMFTMLGASIQKLLSPTYMDGSFFEMALLTEDYFQFLLSVLKIDPALSQLTNNTIAAVQTPTITLTATEVVLPVSALYSAFATGVTVWNLGIQAVLEVLGIFNHKRAQLLFHGVMLVFIHTTYIAAPFMGFGWLICLLCYVFSEKDFPRIGLAYLASLPLLVIYESYWRQFF